MKPRQLVGALLLAILVGAAAGWWLRSRQAETEMSSVCLAHYLEKIGLCAGILGMKEAELSDKTRRVLEHCLASSLSPANELLSSGVLIDMSIPNLREGARRAMVYASEGSVSEEFRHDASEVHSKLEASQQPDEN